MGRAMAFRMLLAVTLAATLATQEPAPAPAPVAKLPRAAMEADLEELAAAIREKWSYLEDKQENFGVDLAALVAAAKLRLPEEGTPAEFHAIVLELVAGLKDGHADVDTPGVADPSRSLPFRLEDTPEGLVVVETTVAAPARGDRVRALDRVPIEARLAEVERSTIASTPGARRRKALERLHGTDAPELLVDYVPRSASAGGSASVVTVSVSTLGPDEPRGPSREAEAAWQPSFAAPGVVRLRIPTFKVEDWTNWRKAAHEQREAFLTKTKQSIERCFAEIAKLPAADRKALVLDLRGNGGGTDLLGIHLAKHLLPKRFVYTRLSAKYDGQWSQAHGIEYDPSPAEQRFDGPLAFLVDEDCFSTTDNFLRAVVENRTDVVVVGRPTNGGTGAPGTIAKLARSGTSVTLCTMRVWSPGGSLIEGRGTVPTVAVRWTAADFLEPRDPDLAAAVEALRK